jgi:hypothetical protein
LAPGVSSGSDEAESDPLLDTGGEDDSSLGGGAGDGSEGDMSIEQSFTWGRLEQCAISPKLIQDGLFRESIPSDQTRVPGCPYNEIWRGELLITHLWHQEQPYGYITVDAGVPAEVELLIIPNNQGGADVISAPDRTFSHPVLLTGNQTLDNKECHQVGSGHYTIEVEGYCDQGWVVLTEVEMIFHEDEPTKLWCDDEDPMEVTTFVPDGTPALKPLCFLISYGSPHGIYLFYDDEKGGTLETSLQLIVGDANMDEIIVPLR